MKRKLTALVLGIAIEWIFIAYANPTTLESTDANTHPAYWPWIILHGPVAQFLPLHPETALQASAWIFAALWGGLIYGLFLQPIRKDSEL